MSSSVIYTPFDLSKPIKAGKRRFWKQVLPVTSINYKGAKIDFDPKFHMDLSQAFKDKAFDQVPVVFADDENRHNMNPRNFGGDVLDMQYRGPAKHQGTWALIEATEDAAEAINKNPRLGVSARIRQMVEKADGRAFQRAVEHVCLTLNPRVSGMEPWQAVDLSDEDADVEVVDLTAHNYKEGSEMGKSIRKPGSTSTDTDTIDLSALSDEDFQRLLDLSAGTLEEVEDEVDEDDEVDEVDEVEVPPTTGKKRKHKSKTKITVEKDSEDDEGDDDEEEEDEEDESTDLSDADRARNRQTRDEVRQMRLDLAEEKWQRERSTFLDAGVPPFLLDLAEPVLSQPDAMVIDLSDDESVNATDTIRKMLVGVQGVVDLTGEIGHQYDLSESDENDSATKFLAAWDEQYG